MKLIIDARKAFDSGIGTYVKSIVPRVLQRLKGIETRVLSNEPELQRCQALFDKVATVVVPHPARALSIAEQRSLRRTLGTRDVFWATSLAHPLFIHAPLIATVHDVAQLALGTSAGTSRFVSAAASVYFKSLQYRADLLMFNSNFTQSEFLKHVGKPRGRAVPIQLGVEPEWFGVAPSAGVSGQPYFICVGNLKPHKNLRMLLRAFASVMDKIPHELVFTGQASGFRTDDNEILEVMKKLGSRVRYLGFVPDAELKSAVAGADALVFPSLYEGWGSPALEAMAAGCPVLASTAGSLSEVCGEAAAYFDPYSLEAIADCLVRHARRPAEEKSLMSLRGIERAQGLSWDHTADLTAECIDKLIFELRSARGAE